MLQVQYCIEFSEASSCGGTVTGDAVSLRHTVLVQVVYSHCNVGYLGGLWSSPSE